MNKYRFFVITYDAKSNKYTTKEFMYDTYEECLRSREICKTIHFNDPNVEITSIEEINTSDVDITYNTNYIDWDSYFMNIAILASLRSKDTTKVGAVIVQNKKIIGVGYNGFPSGIDESQLPTSRTGELHNVKYAYTVHAELNAILNTVQHDISGSSVYVTLFPCCRCMSTLIQKNISEIIYLSDKHHNDPEYIASRKLIDLTSINVRKYSGDLLVKLNSFV